MGRITKVRDLIGIIKDKVSASKAALLSKPNTFSLHLAVLRATTHSPSLDDKHHLSSLLSLGNSSRATASALIDSLMSRLHRTGDATVALKCLIAVHHIIHRGPFILQDQLSIFPSTGGRNYLNLSHFRDGATASSWSLSAWVRFYARYLETLLSSSRILGFFLSSTSSSTLERENQEKKLSSFLTSDLIKDVDSLVALIEEICKVPDSLHVEGNNLVNEVVNLVGRDYLSAVYEVSVRLSEFRERLSCLSFGDSVELTCAMKKLEDCRERLEGVYSVKKASTEKMWVLIGELKSKVGMENVYREGRRREKGIESARFGQRVLKYGDSVEFSSTRFGMDKLSFMLLESVESTTY